MRFWLRRTYLRHMPHKRPLFDEVIVADLYVGQIYRLISRFAIHFLFSLLKFHVFDVVSPLLVVKMQAE